MRRHKSRHRHKQRKIIILFLICFLFIMVGGYAAFSTNLSITAKGNIIKVPLKGKVTEVITNLAKTNPDEIYIDEHNDIRYYGATPNNYVYFNCTDINNQNNDTCELWRIIGVIDSKVKIIKSESIGSMAWNSIALNNWDNSSLKSYLNGEYYNSIEEPSRIMISEETYYLGGAASGVYTTITTSGFYDAERSSDVYTGNPISTTQYIGLMYPSDYGYAAGESCLSTAINSYYISCKNTDYLFSGITEWLQVPHASYSNFAARLNNDGYVWAGQPVTYSLGVRPVLYLKTEVEITDGDGSSDSPFELLI